MTTLTTGVPERMRSPWSFMGSLCLHCWILAWVALGHTIKLEPVKSIFDREIAPNEKRIVWYKLSDKLPDVTPPNVKRDARPPKANSRFEQQISAGAKENPKLPQMILAPQPEIHPAEPLPLPNIVALAPPPKITRPFLPPPERARPTPITPVLPDSPDVTVRTETKPLAIDVKPPRLTRKFTPPPEPKLPVPAQMGTLPDAPDLSAATLAPGEHKLPQIPRKFVPPAEPKRAASTAPAIAAPPPVLTSRNALPSDNSLVIAGLHPTPSLEVPTPPGSVSGGFSEAPKLNPKGGEGAPSGALLEVPSLTIQGGEKRPQPPVMLSHLSPTSPESLAAAYRATHPGAAPATVTSSSPSVRATSAPDPRMYGRQVYTMAVQVPNLTSYSGSWLVWFAGREARQGDAPIDMRPPLPVQMISPKYVATAVEERVQGKIRLWAVIGKDGHVSSVELLQHLDDRLDRTSMEALAKWLFQPATFNGVPVAVDAVFEIPFVLAPKPQRK